MVKTPYLNKYTNSEHIQFTGDVLTVCETYNPVTLLINDQYLALKDSKEQLETVYKQLRGSKTTKKIMAQDAVRDDYIRGIEKAADAFTHHFNPEVRDAAELLLKHIQKYGTNIAVMNYRSETTALSDLIDAYKNLPDLNAAVTLLRLTDWFTELEDSNTEFNRLYLARVHEEIGKPDMNLKELRMKNTELYKVLIKNIEARAIISPSDLYRNVVTEINVLIEKYNFERTKNTNSETETLNEEGIIED